MKKYNVEYMIELDVSEDWLTRNNIFTVSQLNEVLRNHFNCVSTKTLEENMLVKQVSPVSKFEVA